MPDTNREEIAKLEALYASNPEGRVFTHLAEAYRKAGEFERARSILEQGLTKHPAYASAHVVLGRVYADLNDSESATAAFQHVLELDPHNLVALRSLGDLSRARGRTTEALHYFEELRHQDPTNSEIEGIIAELKREPPPAESSETDPETVEEAPAAATSMTTLPGFEDATPDYGDLVTEDVELGWSSAAEAQEALPGDLAEFAAMAEVSAPEPPVADFAEPVDAPIDLSDFEKIEEPVDYASTEDPWAMSLEPAAEAETGAETVAESVAEAEDPAPWEQGAGTDDSHAEAEPVAEIETVTAFAAVTEAEIDVVPPSPVVTETMAELFTGQGLFEQAAEVYRALMAERPWDPDLPIRMAEVEARARGQAVDAKPVAEPVTEPAAEREVEVDSPWMSAAVGTASAPTPYAWAEDNPDTADEGPPISRYFRSLLSWRPGSGHAAQAVMTSAREPEPEGANFEPAPETADLPAFIELDTPSSDPEPWASPAAAPAPRKADPQPSTSANPVEAAFDEWFNASDFGEEAAPAGAAPENPPAEAPAGHEDDDDLEMFRSWLQSLKK